MYTLRPAVAPTTQVFVQELSRLDSAFAPDNMLIISAMLAGFKSENSILKEASVGYFFIFFDFWKFRFLKRPGPSHSNTWFCTCHTLRVALV